MIERRAFLKALLAGSAGPFVAARSVAAEPPPETTRIRLPRYPFDVACVAPMWVAEELLRAVPAAPAGGRRRAGLAA
jgi:NitT/TauT family transport system substrate-binding protein